MKRALILSSLLAATPAVAKPPADKVAICHVPPGNPDAAHTIHVGEAAVKAHLDHGDTRGACGTEHINAGEQSRKAGRRGKAKKKKRRGKKRR